MSLPVPEIRVVKNAISSIFGFLPILTPIISGSGILKVDHISQFDASVYGLQSVYITLLHLNNIVDVISPIPETTSIATPHTQSVTFSDR